VTGRPGYATTDLLKLLINEAPPTVRMAGDICY
jgi:hypothetical protein